MIGEVIAAIMAVGSGCWGAWVKVVKPILKSQKEKKEQFNRIVNDLHSDLKSVKYELTYNGGGSIKDAIHRIEGKLIDLSESQKLTLNIQNVPYWLSDNKGECTYASPALCKIMGRSEDEIKGNSWATWLIQEDKERIFESWMFSVENKVPFDEIYTYRKPDGSFVKVWGLAFHKTVNGQHSGTMGKLELIK